MNFTPRNADTEQKETLEQRYARTAGEFEDFFYMSAHGDLTQIYRNRTCFTGFGSKDELTRAPIRAFLHSPAARPSVYAFTGQMIHECVHHWFNKKEDVKINADTYFVENAIKDMLAFYTRYFRNGTGKGALEEILQWLCELCAELSSKNAGRPAMAHAQQNGDILKILQSNEFINEALVLLDEIVTIALEKNPEGCMRALFEASRHGPHFSWIWLHIATTFQGSIMTHLLESGAEQFNIYATELNNKKSAPPSTSSAVLLNIIQTEYDHKFRAISDVFNFLMAKRNPELQDVVSQLIVDSLDSKVEKKGPPLNRLGFAFFFKLVCCSIKTLQILVTSNGHLVTPFNVVRAIRHVQSVDQSLILPATTYTEFIKNIVTDVDPQTLGMIFGLLIDLVYHPEVFDGENLPEHEESNRQIRNECFQVLDALVNQLARIAHSSGNIKCPAIHPAIEMFSVGDKLQFIIDTIPKNIDKSPVIVRHLHAISVANDETKAAEIALRFIMSIGYKDPSLQLHIFMSYLYATVPYFPNMLSTMWREFGGLKLLIEDSFEGEHLEKRDKTKTHLNILHNIRQLIEWELAPEQLEKPEPNRPFAYWDLFPGEHIGSLLNQVFRETNKLCYEAMEAHRWEDAMLMYSATEKLLESVREACTPVKMLKNNRKVVLSITEMYKLMTQFAIMLKTTLFLITKASENLQGIVVFEELRSQCLCFLFGSHLAPDLIKYSPLFVNYFVTVCLLDSKKLFNENIGESMNCLLDESGIQKLKDNVLLENGPSVLEGLRSLKMRDNALDMLHTGQLKRRRGNGASSLMEVDEDATQRLYAVLDAIRVMCSSGDITIQLTCSQQLAEVLLQTVCKDALMADMKFDEWDVEAEFIHRHVEIAQRLNQSPFCDGLFRILAETRSFALCLPIMKSSLAVILNETEKYPEHKTISEPVREKLHKWMLLAQKGGLIPNRLVYIVDLERFSTCHETFLMLAEVWRFFMFRNLNREIIETYHKGLQENAIDEGLPNEREGQDKVNWNVFRIVIQNHLPEATSLYPKIFPVEYELMFMNIIE